MYVYKGIIRYLSIMVILKLHKIRVYILMSISAFVLGGCATYTENGELVRHHFGYVKVITPAVHAPDAAVRMLEVKTYGLWASVDGRSGGEDNRGYGFGLGYQYDRRDHIPLDCRVVVRVGTQDKFTEFMESIKKSENREEGICVVRDSE